MQGFNPANVGTEYGDTLTFWSWKERRIVQQIKLGPDGLIPLEVRFLHDPSQPHGFVGAALSSNVIHFTKVGLPPPSHLHVCLRACAPMLVYVHLCVSGCTCVCVCEPVYVHVCVSWCTCICDVRAGLRAYSSAMVCKLSLIGHCNTDVRHSATRRQGGVRVGLLTRWASGSEPWGGGDGGKRSWAGGPSRKPS